MSEERGLGLQSECRVFSMIVEQERPKIVNCFMAVYTVSGSKERQIDYTPFEITIKSIAETWFKCLLTDALLPEDCLRVWDIALIHGFEVIHKVCLLVLKHYEDFIINTAKIEVKSLNIGPTIDSLIIAGTLTLQKLFRKVAKLNIEELIQQILKKPTYLAIQRSQYLFKADSMERNNNYRLIRLHQTKQLLKSCDFSLTHISSLLRYLIESGSTKLITRETFTAVCKSSLNWPLARILNLFNTLDYTHSDSLSPSSLSTSLPLFLADIQLQLRYAFIPHPKETISIREFTKALNSIETFLDPCSKSYSAVRNEIFESVRSEFGEFLTPTQLLELLNNNPAYKPIIGVLEVLELDELKPNELRIAEIQLDGCFSNTHSPVRSNTTPIPGVEFRGVDFKELENKLSKILEDSKEGREDREDREAMRINSMKTGSELSDEPTVHTEPIIKILNEEMISIEVILPRNVKEERSCARVCSRQCLVF